MTNASVDFGSLYTLLSSLKRGNPKEWAPWAWSVARNVTCLLWSHPSVEIATGIVPGAPFTGVLEQLVTKMPDVFTGTAPLDKAAMQKTRRWIRRTPSKLSTVYRDLQANPSFRQCVEWWVADWWSELHLTYGCLFDPGLVPSLSQIMGCSPKDLRQVCNMSFEASNVRRWIREQGRTEDSRIAIDAHILAALLRGVYHDYAARNRDVQIMHHPAREAVLSRKRMTEIILPSNVECMVTDICIAGSLAQRNLRARMTTWADNVLRIRQARGRQVLDLRPKDSNSVALEVAIENAEKAGLELHPKWVERFLDAAVGVGTAAATSFVLAPWATIAAAGAGTLLFHGLRVGNRVCRRVYLNKRHLRTLANAAPGRIHTLVSGTTQLDESVRGEI